MKKSAVFSIVCALAAMLLSVPLAAQPLDFRMEVFIPSNLRARVGDTITIPIRVRNLSASAQRMMMENFSFSFRFNPTVLIPLSSSRPRFYDTLFAANNLVEMNLTVPMNNRQLRDNDLIIEIPMLVCLGDVEITELSIDRSALFNYTFRVKPVGMEAFPIPIASVISGLLTVEDARWNNLLLTVNANANQLSMTIAPNPIQNSSRIELGIGTLPLQPALGNPALVLYGITGRDVVTIPINFMGRNTLSLPLPLARLPRGTYFVRFTYGSFSITRMIMVE